MTIEDLQIILALIDSMHRTDDKEIQEKIKRIVNAKLDDALKEME
jgi:hypothetical protein